MQPRCGQDDRKIGSLRLGERARIGDHSPHMTLIVGRITGGLLRQEQGKPGFPIRYLRDHHNQCTA